MKVFLSYPSEHENIAREVKSFVRSTGVECWFDKDNLVAGEDWDRARSVALADADVVLILCAIETTSRNGVYQREINEALRLLADRRLGTVYIIPLRINNDVQMPSELGRLQYVNYVEDQWRRKLAVGLARAVSERGEAVPAALEVAAAQPDEGGLVPRSVSEAPPQGTLDATWFTYAIDGEYWDFVNGVIRSRALGGLYEARRHLAEWWQPTGSSWELHVSEHHRKGQLVSLTVATSSYLARAIHPNHGVFTVNILGEQAGVVPARDLFDVSGHGFEFLTEYVNLDLRRQYAGATSIPDISSYAEQYGWDLFEHYNFNEAGMQINLSAAAGLPHVLGYHQIYLPWQLVGQYLAPVARGILLGL